MLDKFKGWFYHMFVAKPEVKKVTPEVKKKPVVKKHPVVKKKAVVEDTAEQEGKEVYSGAVTSKAVAEKKPVRSRTVKGRYVADDLTTEDYNEAWVGGKAPMKNKPTITRKKSK